MKNTYLFSKNVWKGCVFFGITDINKKFTEKCMYHRYINKEFTEKYIPFEYSTIFHIHATMKLCRNAELVNLQGIKKYLQSQVSYNLASMPANYVCLGI